MKGFTIMATKAEERRTAVTEYLQTNPGSHTADQIAEACGFVASDTVRTLTQLTKNGAIIETAPDTEGTARWAAALTDDVTSEGSDTAADTENQGEAEAVTTEDEPAKDEGESGVISGEAAAIGPDTEAGTATPSGDAQHAPEPSAEAPEPADPADDTDGASDEPEATGPEGEAIETGAGAGEPGDEDASDDAESDQEDEEEEEEAEPVDPDPAVLLVAAQLAAIDGPVSLEQVALAAFRIAAPKTVETTLHVLCALAEHGAVECSTPYRPDDRDRDEKAEWTVAVEAAELDRIAAIAQLADAPASVECPTCGSETELPHLKGHGRKPDGPGGKKKRTGLANGELRDMLIVLVKENPGEELKPNDFVRELRNDPRFKDRISSQPSGAVRSALLAMSKKEKGAWVSLIEGRKPETWRCRDAE